MKTKRPSMPSKAKIREYWTSTKEGQEHIKRIRESYSLEIEYVVDLEADMYICFACNKCTSRLERCHIIPHANGGSSDVSNLVLMCKECHIESPTINNEKIFWTWLDSVEDRFRKQLRELQWEELKVKDEDVQPVQEQFMSTLNKLQTPLVRGKLSVSTIKGVMTEVLDQGLKIQEQQSQPENLLSSFKEGLQVLKSDKRDENLDLILSWHLDGYTSSEIATKCDEHGFVNSRGSKPSTDNARYWIKKASERLEPRNEVTTPESDLLDLVCKLVDSHCALIDEVKDLRTKIRKIRL